MSAPTVKTPQGYEDQAEKEPIAREFHKRLTNLCVALVVSKKERGYREAEMFEGRPGGYKSLTADGNEGRLQDWVYGDRVEMLTGPVLAAIDVDTKNGGNVEDTRAWLQDLGVEILAEIESPSRAKDPNTGELGDRGRHFVIKGHQDLLSTGRVRGHTGVEIKAWCGSGSPDQITVPGTMKYPAQVA